MIFMSPVRTVLSLLLGLLGIEFLICLIKERVDVRLVVTDELADTDAHVDGIRLSRGFVVLLRHRYDPVLYGLLVVFELTYQRESDELVSAYPSDYIGAPESICQDGSYLP